MPCGPRGDRYKDSLLRSLLLCVTTEFDPYFGITPRTHHHRVFALAHVYLRNNWTAQSRGFEHWSRAPDWLQRRKIPRTQAQDQDVYVYAAVPRCCTWPLRYTDGSCRQYDCIEPEVFAQDLLAGGRSFRCDYYSVRRRALQISTQRPTKYVRAQTQSADGMGQWYAP
jgi:hypothetical protein